MTSGVTTEFQGDLVSDYIRHWRWLLTKLKRRTGSQELAEDALQETWLRLASIKIQSAEIGDPQAFILRVAGNIAIDLARRERRHTAHCVNDEALLASVADSTPSPETFVIDRDQLRLLALALAELPPKARMALLLNRCDGLSHHEIATELGVSESMVSKYLAQALRRCRDHFRRAG